MTLNNYEKKMWKSLKTRFVTGLIAIALLLLFSLFIGCKKNKDDFPDENRIELRTISPQPGSSINGAEVLTATFSYSISMNEINNEGFYIYLWFDREPDDLTYGNGKFRLNKRSGEFVVQYNMNQALFTDKDVRIYFQLVSFVTEKGFNVLDETEVFEYRLE